MKQHLYFLQVVGKPAFKIGIARNVEKRVEGINDSLKKERVELITSIRVTGAKKKERFLHDLFACSRFRFKGSGKTEYFRLNWLEACFVLLWFWWFKWRAVIWLVSTLAFLVLIASKIYL